jgi:hypothetical protein
MQQPSAGAGKVVKHYENAKIPLRDHAVVLVCHQRVTLPACGPAAVASSAAHAGEPTAPRALEDTPLTWVDTPASLASMLEALKGAREVALDLESETYRCVVGAFQSVARRAGTVHLPGLLANTALGSTDQCPTDPYSV